MLSNDPIMREFCTFTNEAFKDGDGPQKWLNNARQNLDLLRKWGSACRMNGAFYGKIAVICGAGPSLEKNLSALKQMHGLYVIICVNSAFKYLVSNDVYPDVVVAVDADKTIAEHLDIGTGSDGFLLVSSPCVSPEVFRVWNGCVRFFNLGTGTPEVDAEIFGALGRETTAGGNAANAATSLAIECFGSNIVAFAGMDMSWPEDKRYYVDKPSFNDFLANVWATNIYGEKVVTSVPLYQYKVWLEDVCEQTQEWITYYNITGDGILGVNGTKGLYPFIHQIEAEEFIKLGSENDLQWTVQDRNIRPETRVSMLGMDNKIFE